MAKPLIPLLCAALLAGLPLEVLGQARARAVQTEAEALVQDLLSRRPAKDSEVVGVMKNRAPRQPIYEVPLKLTVELTENGWKDTYETQHVPFHPAEILVIQRSPGSPNQYLYGRSTDPAKRPVPEKLDTNRVWQTFANSDFYLADFGLQFLHWPAPKIVKKEMRKGRSCRVVESVNPNPTPSEYSRVLSWLDVETGNLIRAEGYDHQNKLLKGFSVKKVSRDKGRVELKEIEIRNDQTDSRSNLEFNVQFDE